MEWGAEIKVDGKRPEWLGNTERVAFHDGYSWYGCDAEGFTTKVEWSAWEMDDEPSLSAFRLPATHWAYPVIEKGFWPWKGDKGHHGPLDWDGGPVLYRNGRITEDGEFVVYADEENPNCSAYWRNDASSHDVIGYRRKQDFKPESAPAKVSEWAIDRVAEEHGNKEVYSTNSLFNAFARYIEAHEEAPADPLYDALYEVVQMGRYNTREQTELLRGELDRRGYHIVKKD